ncbi:hypothetical protein [Xanthocytophaga agilis]|uniref:Uncharacterized protein n=1 Tax=Xanthocytophaga agilis TaxID=3048010 RepID=A0AAE3UGS6_9BACT|nr:hypothetical protein [Xanthocytophaga agilis]MDJ1503611.1 hypothetical protein [Xanthocytophaga agilis]
MRIPEEGCLRIHPVNYQAAFFVKFFEALKAVQPVAHHFAGFGHIS